MTVLFIAILFIISIFMLILKKKKIGMGILLVAVICYFIVGSGLFPSILLNQLQAPFIDLPNPEWKSQNAIVLLGAGTVKLPKSVQINPTIMAYSRIYKTASLYLGCIKNHKCTVVVSGGDALSTGKSEAVVYRDALIQLGVSHSDIKLEDRSMNTYKNAEFTSAILKQGQFNYIVLVTSGIHLRRSLLYFSHFGVEAAPILADYLAPIITILPLGYNLAMADFAIHEYLGLARFYIYQFLGWNYSASRPGTPKG